MLSHERAGATPGPFGASGAVRAVVAAVCVTAALALPAAVAVGAGSPVPIGGGLAFTGATVTGPLPSGATRTLDAYQTAVFVQSWLPAAIYGRTPVHSPPPPGARRYRVDTTGTWDGAEAPPTTRAVFYATDGRAGEKALQMVQDICAVAEPGKTYLGKVVRIVDFGAFVEIFPGTDGLLHISEISESRVKNVRDELNEGDQIMVKVLALEGNKIKLSRRAILKEQREKLAQQ